MAEHIGPVPSGVEEPTALSVPPPSDPQQLPKSTTGEDPKDGAELSIAAAGDNGALSPQPTTRDASHTEPSPVTVPPLQPTPPVHAIPNLTSTLPAATPPPPSTLYTLPEIPAAPVAAPLPPPSLTSTHSHPTTSLSLSSTANPASASTASLSTSPSSTDTQTLTSARAALEATILSTGTAYTHPIEARARDLHAMNTALATQQTQLLSATGALAKENDRLAKLAEEGGRRLKEVGALDVWAEVLEGDLAAVEECLRIVEGGGEERCESCGGDLGGVDEDAVRWCGGCDGLWHTGCCGEEGVSADAAKEAEGVADWDGEVEWRCRECALREDLEAMVGELGGFVDDEMDTSGEITVEPPRGDTVHDGGGEAVMEEARNWKGKGVVYPNDDDVRMEVEGEVAGGEEVGAIGHEGGAASGADVLEKPGVYGDVPSASKQTDLIQNHEATDTLDSGERPLEMDRSRSDVTPSRRAAWTWGI
ncbi:hypothetical protein VE03_09943 [Pseudogymnoascus sp. 23342-1-I1]|nr:hypothetical protein VE03_09943 [Pseudogymnoascus sp. 23342-1-I1]